MRAKRWYWTRSLTVKCRDFRLPENATDEGSPGQHHQGLNEEPLGKRLGHSAEDIG